MNIKNHKLKIILSVLAAILFVLMLPAELRGWLLIGLFGLAVIVIISTVFVVTTKIRGFAKRRMDARFNPSPEVREKEER